MDITFKVVLSDDELKLPSIKTSSKFQSPDGYAIINNDNIHKRIDIVTGDGVGLYQKGIIFNNWYIIGCNYNLFWILNDFITIKTFKYDGFSYFMDLLCSDNYVLVIMGDRIIRFDLNVNVIWDSHIALDGIIVNKVEENKISCFCEMDPPGGWVDKVIDVNTGSIL